MIVIMQWFCCWVAVTLMKDLGEKFAIRMSVSFAFFFFFEWEHGCLSSSL